MSSNLGLLYSKRLALQHGFNAANDTLIQTRFVRYLIKGGGPFLINQKLEIGISKKKNSVYIHIDTAQKAFR